MGKVDPLDAHPRLCLEALTPSGLVPPPEMGPSLFPSPTPQTPLSRPRIHTPAPLQNQPKYKLKGTLQALTTDVCSPGDSKRNWFSGAEVLGHSAGELPAPCVTPHQPRETLKSQCLNSTWPFWAPSPHQARSFPHLCSLTPVTVNLRLPWSTQTKTH